MAGGFRHDRVLFENSLGIFDFLNVYDMLIEIIPSPISPTRFNVSNCVAEAGTTSNRALVCCESQPLAQNRETGPDFGMLKVP